MVVSKCDMLIVKHLLSYKVHTNRVYNGCQKIENNEVVVGVSNSPYH